MAFAQPSWDFSESEHEEIDYANLQPFELAQQSLRPPKAKRRSQQQVPSSVLSQQPIPGGPNQPQRQRSRSFGAGLGQSPVEEDVRRGATSSSPARAPVGQQQHLQQQHQMPQSPSRVRPRSSSSSGLNRSQTLLSHSASPHRSSQELSRLLAKSPSSRKLAGGADGRAEEDARLEAGRRKARVVLDVDLEREILVEGGDVKGTMMVTVRPGPKKEGPVHVGQGKIRLVGFEDVPSHDGRHIFYHHSATLPLFVPGTQHRSSLFTSTPGTHHPSNPGSHPIPFHLPLPLTDFPRGPHRSSSSSIRYILIASLSLFFPFTGKSSIAHFYRNVVVFPKIDPARVLGTAGAAVESARSFGNPAGKGVELGVKVGKSMWVAGMSCWVDISMYNGTSKKIKSLTVQLWQTTVLYHPSLTSTRPASLSGNLEPGSTSTKQKKVAETVLAEAQASGKGLITGKGWFTGCAPLTAGSWSTSLLLPPDALSIPRGRLIEVSYAVRVCVDSKIFVEVPIRIVNFISIDPPPSTYRAPVAPRKAPAAPALLSAMDAVPAHESPKSMYTDGVIGYDTISRPRMPALPSTGTLASTLKKARSMGSLAFPGEMGNRHLAGSNKGPLRVANRLSSDDESDAEAREDLEEGDDDDDDDEARGEQRGLIRRKASMAVLKEAVDAAAREMGGFDELDEEAYGYSYDGVDLGVDIPKLVSESTFIATGDPIEEEEEALADEVDAANLDDERQQQMLGVPKKLPSSPMSQSPTVMSEESAFAYDDAYSIPPLSHLPTPVSETPPTLPLPTPSTMESNASIGQAMQTLLLDDAATDSEDDHPEHQDLVNVAPRFPAARASSPMLRAARSASMMSLAPTAPMERKGSDATIMSSRTSYHPSNRLSMAWGAAATAGGSRLSLADEPTYEEARSAVTQGRRHSALTPEPAFKSNNRLSIATDLVHPEAIQKPRTPSPRVDVTPLPSMTAVGPVAPDSPARSTSSRKTFTFASPAAPIRVKASVASLREGTPPRPARLRTSVSSLGLSRSATQDSPVKLKPAMSPAASPSRPMSAYARSSSPTKQEMDGHESPVKAGASALASPRRSRTLHTSAASPLKLAPSIRELPPLADGRASSDSGSASEVTPPLAADVFPPVPTSAAALNFAEKLQFTNRHLSQHFDPAFEVTKAPPRANSVDSPALFAGRAKTPGSLSVKSKIQNLEQRQSTSEAVPPALRRSATTASPRYGPSDDLKFIRPGHHRRESSLSEETADALAAESNLRRAPSGVSFKAPLLRHSKSVAGNLRQNS